MNEYEFCYVLIWIPLLSISVSYSFRRYFLCSWGNILRYRDAFELKKLWFSLKLDQLTVTGPNCFHFSELTIVTWLSFIAILSWADLKQFHTLSTKSLQRSTKCPLVMNIYYKTFYSFQERPQVSSISCQTFDSSAGNMKIWCTW